MNSPARKTILLLAAALCLVVQGAFALPDCRCSTQDDLPPCHQSTPAEPAGCCSNEAGAPASDACSTAMQLDCCRAEVAPATTVAIKLTVDQGGGEEFLEAAAKPVAFLAHAPADPVAIEVPVARSAPPVWLLNSTLLN